MLQWLDSAELEKGECSGIVRKCLCRRLFLWVEEKGISINDTTSTERWPAAEKFWSWTKMFCRTSLNWATR